MMFAYHANDVGFANDDADANDVVPRSLQANSGTLGQTSHHCVTKWSNIIFAKQMHHIAIGDASFEDIQGFRLDLFANV